MCGIAAIFAYGESAPPVDRAEVIRMREQMFARGPDGEGEWFSDDGRVGLGHRRLTIIDLSPAGAQPMWNADRSLAIIFNGEIYNYRELRSQLSGYQFRSHCDTEVLLALYETRGEAMLNELRGMYAFVIWDKREQRLFLARDPFGIKPLYYSDNGNTFRVASQVKPLRDCGKIDLAPDPAGHVGTFYGDTFLIPILCSATFVACPPAAQCGWIVTARARRASSVISARFSATRRMRKIVATALRAVPAKNASHRDAATKGVSARPSPRPFAIISSPMFR